MNILVIGGTRFFGIPMVTALLNAGHQVTVASRGRAADPFGDSVNRIIFDRSDAESIRNALSGAHFDVVIDKIAYCSNDIRNLLDVIHCDKYIYMSTTAVYDPKRINTTEEDFSGYSRELIWCDRPDFSYDEVKRQAEIALCQSYGHVNWTAVRYPVVLGEDDYTNRLRFYAEHILKGIPMHIDNLHRQMGFIRSDEAGKFIAFLADKDFPGPINGCSHGTVSLEEIIRRMEFSSGRKAVISSDGDPAPYNGETEYSINTDKAEALGFKFSHVRDWIFDLADHYVCTTGSDAL